VFVGATAGTENEPSSVVLAATALLAALPGASLAHPADGNEVFAHLPEDVADALRDAGAQFYRWLDGSYRFVCSWSTPVEDVANVLRIARSAANSAAV